MRTLSDVEETLRHVLEGDDDGSLLRLNLEVIRALPDFFDPEFSVAIPMFMFEDGGDRQIGAVMARQMKTHRSREPLLDFEATFANLVQEIVAEYRAFAATIPDGQRYVTYAPVAISSTEKLVGFKTRYALIPKTAKLLAPCDL